MKITTGILFYLLDRYDNMQHICHGADRMELNRTEHFRNQKETEKGVLYIYADKKGVLLFCSEKEYKASYILMKALKETDEAYSSLWIPYGDQEKNTLRNAHLADEVSEYVSQIWNYFSQVQNDILEAILSQEEIGEVMDKVRVLLRTPFVLISEDFHLIYEHPDISKIAAEETGKDDPNLMTENLQMMKEWDDAEKMNAPFYYFMKDPGRWLYCINILSEGNYYARLAVYGEKGRKALPSGGEQIAEYLSGVIGQMIRQGASLLTNEPNDMLHSLLLQLLEGYEPEAAELSCAIKEYQWEESQTYQMICLEPYMANTEAFSAEKTIPAILRKLEQNQAHSCAVFSDRKIMWVRNLTRSETPEDSGDFSQWLTSVLTEYGLRAGASSSFRNIKLFSSAWKEAEAALKTGIKRNSGNRFYRFDDYRLSFMLDRIRVEEIDSMLLIHPAIPILMEHDQTHENELTKTLETLIEKQGNVTQAAEALLIHRTTLFRRLNQIKELTGINLEDEDLLLELQLSYRILKK